LTAILHSVGHCLEGVGLSTVSHGLVTSLFFAGMVSGFTHCMGMCGPFVISQTKTMEKMSDAILLPYHIGRLTTYTLMAVLLNTVLNVVFLFLPLRSVLIAPVLLTASLIFIVNAFPQIGQYFSWILNLRIAVPYRVIADAFQKLSHHPTGFKKFILGMILGFMPCGMVTSALMASATAPDVGTAAMAMAAFGVGTIPALMVTSFAGQALTVKYPHIMPYVTKGMMIWSSAWLIIIAGIILI